MAGSRASRLLGLFALLATLASFPARSQESATADTSPEETLKNLGLARSGTTWVLADEKTVLKDLRDTRDLYRQVAQGMMNQQMLAYGAQNRQAALVELRAESAALNQSIAAMDAQLNSLVEPPGGNIFVQQQRQQLSQERNQLVAAHNQVVNQLNSLQEQAQNKDQDQDPRLQLNAEVAQSREKYMQAVLDLRKSVDEVMAKYNDLAKNPEVAKALAALSGSSKNKHKLGPSKALLDAIKLLKRTEGTVQSANVSLHKEDGVFHLYATLNKVPTKMVFDTGAGLTTISSVLAKKIGLKPRPNDAPIKLKTADGTVVDGKQMTIPSVRVGKFTIANVECAVMPADKGDVDPLLGQSFLKHFKVDFSPETGKLSLKRVDTAEADSSSLNGPEPTRPASKAATKARRSHAQPKATVKTKRGARTRQPMPDGSDQPAPGDGTDGPPN